MRKQSAPEIGPISHRTSDAAMLSPEASMAGTEVCEFATVTSDHGFIPETCPGTGLEHGYRETLSSEGGTA